MIISLKSCLSMHSGFFYGLHSFIRLDRLKSKLTGGNEGPSGGSRTNTDRMPRSFVSFICEPLQRCFALLS